MRAGILAVLLGLWALSAAADDDPREISRQVVLEAVLGDKVMLSIDGERHTLGADQPARKGVRVLRISPDRVEIEVNGQSRQLRLGEGSVVAAPYKQRAHSEVTIVRNAAGMYTTVGSINGLPVDFLVDTGATTIAMNASQARRLGIDFRLTGQPTMVGTASGVTQAYRVVLDSVTVGEISARQVPAVVIDGGFPLQVLLGMSFLGRVEIQREGALMRLKQRY